MKSIAPGLAALAIAASALVASGSIAPPEQPSWWAFQPPTKPAVPAIQNPKSKIQNPIDAFLLAKLREKGLDFAPQADHRTLIRRIHFDLTGDTRAQQRPRQADAENDPDYDQRNP